MKSTNEYLIPFIGLKLGKHQFDFQISKKFFDEFGFDEFEHCDIKVDVVLEKEFKEFCRIKKIPQNIRGYIFLKNISLDFIK